MNAGVERATAIKFSHKSQKRSDCSMREREETPVTPKESGAPI
jgi:hypothetical protein